MKQAYLETEEQKMLKETAKNFANRELEPIAAELDEKSEFPVEVFKKLADIGFCGLGVTETYGGSGGDFTSICIIIEELSKVCPAFAMSTMVHLGMVQHGALLTFANEEQKRYYLPKLTSGKAIGAFALTEPGAGSDAYGVKTVAEKIGEYYIINGSKTFITNPAAPMNSIMIVTAQTGTTPDGKKEFSNFIIEKETDGVSVGNHFDKLGMRASPTSEIFFENVKVSEKNILGTKGKGLRQALTILDFDRILASCIAIGILDRCFSESIEYAKTRKQFGRTISEFQAIQFKIADMESELRASRALLAETLKISERDPHSKEFMLNAAALKLFSTTSAIKGSLEAIQIFGGYGYMKEYPVERFMRDSKLLEIGGGSSEVLRLILSRESLRDVK